jgi:hypothetical protein
MLQVQIVGEGGRVAKVGTEGELSFTEHSHPVRGEIDYELPFRQYITDDGAATGSNDLAVNGATNSQTFWVNGVADYDRYIVSLSFLIGDGGSPALNKFGSLSALANGLEFSWVSSDLGTRVLHEGIKTNLELTRLSMGMPAFGSGVDAFLADVSGGGTEKSYLPVLRLDQFFGMKHGIRLRKGSNDQLAIKVQDDLSALTTFNIIAGGKEL